MAHSLFDAITGVTAIDNSTYLAVQSLLDAQSLQDHQQSAPPQVVTDDEDVFQCGKCKKQFTILNVFMSHKSTCSGPPPQLHVPQNHSQQQYSQRQPPAISPTAALTQLNTSMVLPDDIMTLTLDQTSALQVPGSGMQNNPFLSSAHVANRPSPQTSTFPSSTSLPNFTTTVSGQLQLQPVTLMPMNNSNGGSNGNIMVTRQQLQGHQSNNNMITVIIDGNADQALQVAGNTPTQSISLATTPLQQPETVATETPKELEKSVSSQGKGQRSLTKRVLSCQFCDKSFHKKFDLQQHMRAHTGEKPFQCVVCGRAFSQKSNVKKHMQTHKVWPSKGSSTLPEQPEPQLVVVQETEPVSPEQNQTSAGEDDVATRVKWHYFVDNSYVCPYCDNPPKFDTYYKLRTHMVQHKNVQVYRCVKKDCNETFGELDDFLEHIKTHEKDNDMTYRCHVCSQRFPSLYHLGAHQYTHSITADESSDPTNKDNKSQWCYKCTLCSSVYTSPEALENHLATSTHEYSCPHCSKIYPCERYLRRHLVKHDSAHQLKCNVCNKSYKSEQYLKIHALIHTGAMPFSCTVCNKKFNRKDKVKRHMLVHDEEKKFKCPFKDLTGCTRAFRRADKLKEHTAKHTNHSTKLNSGGGSSKSTNPPTCRFCHNCKFQTQSQLIEHESMCLQVPRMKCGKCQLTFNTKEMLDTHECSPEHKDAGANSAKSPPYRRNKRKAKRPRGRPPKKNFLTPPEPIDPNRPKRKPGRPRKHPLPEPSELASNLLVKDTADSDLVGDQIEQDTTSNSQVNVAQLQKKAGLVTDPMVTAQEEDDIEEPSLGLDEDSCDDIVNLPLDTDFSAGLPDHEQKTAGGEITDD